MARSGSDGVRAEKLTSNPPKQHKNDNDDQDDADDTDAAVSVAVTVTAEAAAKATKQENDEDDDEDEPQRHGLVSNLLRQLKAIAAPESVQYCSHSAGCGPRACTRVKRICKFIP